MNQKVKRIFDAMAVAMVKLDNDKLINDLHEIIADKKDGYPEYNFVATVNSFRVLSGYHNMVKQEE